LDLGDDEVECEVDSFAPDTICPEKCPYAAEMKEEFCHFKCVVAKQCGIGGSVEEATIPDLEKHECRRCDVEGCATCVHGEPGEDVETCQQCMPGYFMEDEGEECKSSGDWIFGVIAAVAVLAVIVAVAWYADLASKPIVNESQIDVGQAYRSRTKARQQGVPGRPLYPIDTDLNNVDIAGVGTMVFFRFQTAVLIWAITGFLLFLGLGLGVSTDLFKIGIKKAVTPQQFCAVIKWGRARQMELVWTKVAWLAFMYPFSILGAFYYSINSQRLFDHMDNEQMTMSDYVASIRDIPKVKGTDKTEEKLKEAIEKASGEKVVGVSCAWDFHDHAVEHHVLEACEYETSLLDKLTPEPPPEETMDGSAWDPEKRGFAGKIFDHISFRVLAAWKVHLDDTEAEHDPKHIKEMVEGIESTDSGFVVFETEGARDRALEKLKDGFEYDDTRCRLEPEENEPEAIVWVHYGISEDTCKSNMVMAFFYMGLSVLAWTVLLYLPYEHYMASFSYANGDEPGEISEIIFVCLVVVAQIGLFVCANVLAHHAGFRYEDNHQCAYIVLYNSALIVNLILDIGLTCILSYHQMVGRGVRTADGSLLGDLPSVQMIFESYPMQKSIGNQLFRYCWPATFFLPFSGEPPGMIWLPWHIGRLMIRSHPHLRGAKAEKSLRLGVMEQGRYADLMFNAILVCCIPFIAPAYMLLTFGAMIFSHIYIYLFDHVRTLRSCTRYHFSSNVCNLQGQKIFAIPCGLLAAGLVFKWNQMKSDPKKLGGGPLQGAALWQALAGAFFGHIIFHLVLLEFVVPMFHDVEKHPEEKPYSECAKIFPASWFSTNPVHCLRSKYIYEHEPPQTFYVIGKEHLAQKNEAIGAHFQEEAAEVEDYTQASIT